MVAHDPIQLRRANSVPVKRPDAVPRKTSRTDATCDQTTASGRALTPTRFAVVNKSFPMRDKPDF
jgi:hypothetical protein